MLGADYVVGTELDREALDIAAKTSNRFQLDIDWVLADIETLHGTVDTVVMNPPFGTKRPHADTQFLQVAIRIARVAYSIHKTSTREYLEHWFQEHGSTAELLTSTNMEIPHQFSFHKKRRRFVDIDVFRIMQT
jgi:putative methylase